MYGKTVRLISLLAAGALALVILIYPLALSRNGATPSYGLLALIMLGISAGFMRVTMALPEDNARFLAALKELL